MSKKFTEHDLLLISTALIAHRKILESIQQRATKRDLARTPEIIRQRQNYIARINEILAKIDNGACNETRQK